MYILGIPILNAALALIEGQTSCILYKIGSNSFFRRKHWYYFHKNIAQILLHCKLFIDCNPGKLRLRRCCQFSNPIFKDMFNGSVLKSLRSPSVMTKKMLLLLPHLFVVKGAQVFYEFSFRVSEVFYVAALILIMLLAQ